MSIDTVMKDLFEPEMPAREAMAEGAVLLRGKARAFETDVLAALQAITAQAPFRHMTTPGGFVMSVAMTNCGAAGQITDRAGYRYDRIDPDSGRPWPALPDCFADLAVAAATDAGYPEFVPDACLINRYEPGARLSLHQDKNERDLANPIVSVSLGLPATFQFGGLTRTAPVTRFALRHGDVAVWGGPSRLCYHGVTELKAGEHTKLGRMRINLTFRRALQSMITATDQLFATDAPRDGEFSTDPAKALVMASLSGLVSRGHAQWRSLRNGDVELRLATGEVFLLGDRSVTRTA